MSEDLTPKPPVDAALAEGQRLLSAGLADDAVRRLRDALGLVPDLADARQGDINYHLGCALLLCDRAGEARVALRRATRDDRLRGLAWFQISSAETRLGHRVRALVALRQVVCLRPDWATARLRYGESLLRLGRVDAAMAEAVEVLRLDPELAEAHRLHGVTLCCQRRFGQAAAAFAAWVGAVPDDAMAEYYLARAQLLANDRAAAQVACGRAIGRDPTLVRGHLLLARIALANGNLEKAQTHLKNAVTARPNVATLRARLAALMLRRSQLQAASAMARHALALDPGCLAALVVAIHCHIARGELVRAQTMLTQLAQSVSANGELAALRAELAAGRGKPLSPKPVEGPTRPGATPRAMAPVAMPPPAPTELSSRDGPAVPPATTAVVTPSPSSLADVYPDTSDHPFPGRGFAGPEFVDHLFIIRALILRDLHLKYQGNSFGFVMEVIRPLVVVIAHYYLFYLLRRPMPGDIPIEEFVIAGFSVWFAFNYTAQGAISAGRWPGGATAMPGVTLMHLRLARATWALLINLVFCLTATLFLTLYGDTLPMPNVPLTVAIFGIAGTMGFGYGLLTEQLARVWPVSKPFAKLSFWALFVTSALYFSFARIAITLPVLAGAMWYNPLLHLVEYERHAFDPGYSVAMVSLFYPTLFAAGLMVTALMLIQSTRHRAHA